ncbi:MAG: hypothetical protein J6A04_00985 [Clostridia bacterium]|nr:hypothetical protein [Clostridia bacterium]
MKSQKGITMVSLVITVIILIILSSIGITIGTNSISSSNDSKLTSELLMVQHAVLEQYTKFQTVKDKGILVGNKMQLTEVQAIAQELGITLVSIPDNYSNKDYYRLDKAALLEIGIKDTNDEYIINYVSGEVMNITQKTTSNNNALYVKGNSFYQ